MAPQVVRLHPAVLVDVHERHAAQLLGDVDGPAGELCGQGSVGALGDDHGAEQPPDVGRERADDLLDEVRAAHPGAGTTRLEFGERRPCHVLGAHVDAARGAEGPPLVGG